MSRDCDGGDDHKKCCGQPSPDIYHSGISSYDTQQSTIVILRTNDKRVFSHQLRLIHPDLSCNILGPHSLSYSQVRQRGAGLPAAARRHEPGPGRGPGPEQCSVLYCTVLYCTVLYCTGQEQEGREAQRWLPPAAHRLRANMSAGPSYCW